MKLFCCTLFLVFLSCSGSKEDGITFDANTFPQQWELTGMSTGISGQFLEGDDLPWTETIVLKTDMRFVKMRFVDNQKKEGEGVFEFNEINDETYLILNYDFETDLIESCG